MPSEVVLPEVVAGTPAPVHSFVSCISDTGLCVLHQIAQDLDEAEKKLMLESGMESADYLRFVAEESGNVAGKVSKQVALSGPPNSC